MARDNDDLAKDNDDLAKSEAEGSDTPIAAQAVEVADFEFNEQNSDVEITPIEAERSGLGDDDTFSAPAAATKVDIARLRKDEDGEQDGIPAKGGNEGQDELVNIRAAQLDDTIHEEHGRTLDDTLGQILDTSTQQGGATAQTGADVKPALGGEQLAGLTEVDEAEDLNPNDVIES